MSDDPIAKCGEYRGVPLDAGQNPARLVFVYADIDAVFEAPIAKLLQIVSWPDFAPEARRLAGALLEAAHQLATDRREARPGIDLEFVRAALAGLDSISWQDHEFFCSMFDRRGLGSPGHAAVQRDKPLDR